MSEVDSKVKKALKALDKYYMYDQEKIDYIVKKASVAALNKHLVLAKEAVEETGRGRIEDKATKNIFACEEVTNYLAKQKTVGVIEKNDVTGITKIADPVGVVAGVTPVTNPTSTTIFKALLAIKTRNPIIFGFHPSAQKCSVSAAKIVYEAAVKAGAPEDCVQWVEKPSLEATSELMGHEGVSTILATGGNAMVKAAYSQGKPALGVGAGNVPSYIEKTADIPQAINDIVLSKSFDYGMICASEQVTIIDSAVYSKAITEFKKLHAYICNEDEKAKLENFIFGVKAYSKNCADQKLNPNVVGKSPQWIAEQAGFKVPEDTTILITEIKKVGKEEPMSAEKLSPVLGLIKVSSSKEGFDIAEKILENGGLGHSACIHSNDSELVEKYGEKVKACRILHNTPTSFGGIGDLYNAIIPSLTLGCGSYGHNSVSGNVSACNLVNVKQIGRRNNNMQWFKIPNKVYIEPNSIQYLRDMEGIKKVSIVTDKIMNEIGVVQKVLDELRVREGSVNTMVIDYVEPEPSIDTVTKGAAELRAFNPDTIIAVGGGSPMDAAKVMRLLYEHEEIEFADIREKFLDIRKRAFKLPATGIKAKLVCIPTTSGTGSEVTPFAVITDHKSGYKYPLADYVLTPDVAIVDPVLARTQPKSVAAYAGYDALTHCVESYTSVFANDFTDGLAKQGFELIFKNLERAVNGENQEKVDAQLHMHNAATVAGMAFGSAFLGMCHGMAHTIGSLFHIQHGRTNAILLANIVRYNGQVPTKATAWPKYNHYHCAEKYQKLVEALGISAKTPKEGIEKLAKELERLRKEVGIESSLQEAGVDEKSFISKLDEIAMRAYEDQCTPANPRVPILEDMKMVAIASYYGISFDEAAAKLKKLK